MTTEQIQVVAEKASQIYNSSAGYEMVMCIRLALAFEGYDYKHLTRKESDKLHRTLRKLVPEGYAVAM
ncbi:MAG: hypothetical protein H0X33_13330 [Taibaiella sp.]|nr:hypothetical protein [Taibaiella sp.]